MVIKQSIEAALIIGYRRVSTVEKIIGILEQERVQRIYIAVDAAKAGDSTAHLDVQELLHVIEKRKITSPSKIFLALQIHNAGCAKAVIQACDWFFSKENFGIILEDDCIPTPDFLTFAALSRSSIDTDKDIWLACGTQFAPEEASSSIFVSRYALIWGWATSNLKWRELRAQIFIPGKISKDSPLTIYERHYWDAGARRAESGIVDVWDTLLLQRMQRENKKSLLPSALLVKNVGADAFAIHTKKQSAYINAQTGNFIQDSQIPRFDANIDMWLKKYFYKIRPRHLLTTKITYFLDRIRHRLHPYMKLSEKCSVSTLVQRF